MTEEFTPENPRYPHIYFDIPDVTSPEGNAFWIMGTVRKLLQRHGIDAQNIETYISSCMTGTYDDLLYVTSCWVMTS